MSTTGSASSLLHEHGLKDTLPRRAVVHVLSSARTPLSVQEILKQLEKEDHSIGLVTVYRVVEALIEAGLVHRHPVGGTLSLCTLPDVHGHHILLRCVSCDRTEEAHDDPLCKREEIVAKQHGFSSIQHVSELLGTCARCR